VAKEDAVVSSTLKKAAGIRDVVASADYRSSAVAADDLAKADAVHFQRLGIAVINNLEAVQALAAAASSADSPIAAIEPEYIAYPSADSGLALEYLRGYRDAVNHVYEKLSSSQAGVSLEGEALAGFQDTAQFTWGLQATRASTSSRSGQGIKVAVLDTGMDFSHPDYLGRNMVSQSFVDGVSVDDIFGHGTHCIGTACGPQRPASGVRRYGVAYGAQIFVGKVFDNSLPRPRAPTASVVAGVEWAMANGCRIVSLSLGIPINQKVMQYETPIKRALDAGTLVVAAAGNNAQRPSNVGFVEPPANSDGAMAVAAIDSQLRIAEFSARSSQVTGVGGIVNICAPGVAVFSSVPVAKGTHAKFDGTSMATPHVAGIAALWAQATGESGMALWNRLLQTVRPLNLPSVDIGAGMAQAPQ
jgi:subtilisin family serine protease